MVFGYTPLGHRRNRKQAVGLTVRVRRRRSWRWLQLQAYWPRADLRRGRGCAALEATTWRTDACGKRATVKVFARLKVGLGGPR